VPQYLPGAPSYSDVRDLPTMAFVETAQASPGGALFTDVVKGGRFRPTEGVTRLVAAVALVRAAGLKADAEALTNTTLSFADALTIPAELRGYVSVAVSKGFIQADTLFRPQDPFTRGELAHAIALIQNSAVQ
jgi:serine protease AprX